MEVELAEALDSAGADLASLPVAELANDMALPPFRLTSQFLREVRLEDGDQFTGKGAAMFGEVHEDGLNGGSEPPMWFVSMWCSNLFFQ